MRTKIDKYIGVFFTVMAVAAIEAMKVGYKVPTITSIFTMLIVFSVFKGGILPGMGSTIIAAMYIYYLRAISPKASDFKLYSSNELILDIMAMLCIVIMAVIIDYKYRSYYKKFKENDEYISRAEDLSAVMVCCLSAEGRFVKVPQKLCSTLGYTEDELLNMYWRDITYSEDTIEEEKLVAELIIGNKETYKIEKRFHKKDGETVWVFCSVSAVKNNDGEIIYLLKYLIDVTEQKVVREKLEDQLDFLHKLMDAIPNPIFIENIKDKKLSVNRAFTEYAGRDYNNARYADMLAMVDKDEADKIIKSCARAISSNHMQQHNVILPGLSRQNRHAIINIAPYTDINGNIAGVIGSITDITHIKQMEEAFRENEAKYQNLVEIDPDAVMILERDTITFINNAGLRIFGVTKPEEIIGKSLYEFVHPDYVYNVQSHIGRAYININQAGIPFEVKIIAKSGGEVEAEVVNIAFRYRNKTQVMAIIRDITERIRTEVLKMTMKESERQLMEAKEYDRIKNEFFANISHELRTPLNVILGTLQLLIAYKNSSTNGNIDKHLAVMRQNCYRLLRLVSNLIDITKMDAGYFKLNMGSYNIVSIVEDITLSLVDYVEGKGLILEFDTDIEEKIINCDSDQMERIMLNLISNAIKFSKAGSKINVSFNDNGDSVIIKVRDTGIGIPEEKQKIIFERFRQVDKSMTRDNEGSGIGLSLVKSLVEMHGGTISIKSKPEIGSEFIIELPADKEIIHRDEVCAAADVLHIERIKIEFSDIYS